MANEKRPHAKREDTLNYLDDLFCLAGKTSVVTGASTGLRLMMAEALVRTGARVLIGSRKGADCERVAAELTALGPGTAEGFAGDVGTEEGVAALSAAIKSRTDRLDILAPRGTAVRSTTEGVVSSTRRNELGGNVVWVTGPAGWRHYYAHLDRRAPLREGQWVEAGALLGWVGNSGNAAAGPTHLHYGIYLESGRSIDPYPLLIR